MMENQPQQSRTNRPPEKRIMKLAWNNSTKVTRAPYKKENPLPIYPQQQQPQGNTIPQALLKSIEHDSDMDEFFSKNVHHLNRGPKAFESANARGIHLHSHVRWNPEESPRVPYPPPPTSIQPPQPMYQNEPAGLNYTTRRSRDYPKPWRTNNILADRYHSHWMPTQQPDPQIHSIHIQNGSRPVIVDPTLGKQKQQKKEIGRVDKKTKLENPPVRKSVRFAGNESQQPQSTQNPINVTNVKPPQVVGTKLNFHLKPSLNKRSSYIPYASSRVTTQYQFLNVSRPYPKPWLMEYQQSDEDPEILPPPPITEEDRNGNLRKMKSQKEVDQPSNSVKPKPIPAAVARKSQIIAAHPGSGIFTFENAVRELRQPPSRPIPVVVENKNKMVQSGQAKQDNPTAPTVATPNESTTYQLASSNIPILKSELTKYFCKAAVEAVNMTHTPVKGIIKNWDSSVNPAHFSTPAEVAENVKTTAVPKPKPRRNPNPAVKPSTIQPSQIIEPRRPKTAKKPSNTTDDESDVNKVFLKQRLPPRPEPPPERFKVSKYIKGKGWEPREDALRYQRHRQLVLSRSKSKPKRLQTQNRLFSAPRTQSRARDGNNGSTRSPSKIVKKKQPPPPPPPTSGDDSEPAPKPRRQTKRNPKSGGFDLKKDGKDDKDDNDNCKIIPDENLNAAGSYTIVPNKSGAGFVKLFPDGRQVLMSQMVLMTGAQNNIPNNTNDSDVIPGSRYSLGEQPISFSDPAAEPANNSPGIGHSYTVLSIDFSESRAGTRSIGVGTSSGTEVSSSQQRIQLPSPPPTPPMLLDTRFYSYAATDINYTQNPFMYPGLLINQIPIEKLVGDEFSTVFPPPTPYKDEKSKCSAESAAAACREHFNNDTERHNQSGKNLEYESEKHRLSGNRHDNQESKSPSGFNVSNSRRRRKSPAENRKVLWNSEGTYTTSIGQSRPYLDSVDPNESFLQYATNSGPFEPLHSFQQMIQAELNQYQVANSQFPEGSFLPRLTNQGGQVRHKSFQFPSESGLLRQYEQDMDSPPLSKSWGLAQSIQSHTTNPHQFQKQILKTPQNKRPNSKFCADPTTVPCPRQRHRVSFKLPATKSPRISSPEENLYAGEVKATANHKILEEVCPDEPFGDGDNNNNEAETRNSSRNASRAGNSATLACNNDDGYRSYPIPRHLSMHPIFQNLELDEFVLKHFRSKNPSTGEPCDSETALPPTPASGDSESLSMCVKLSHESLPYDSPPGCECEFCKVIRKYRIGLSRSLSCLDQINYLQRNVKEMRKIKKPPPPTKVVDHPKGDRVRPAPTYASRKGYGKVPAYITKRKEEIAKEKERKRQIELEQTINQIKSIEKAIKEKKCNGKMKKMRQYLIKVVADETRDMKKLGKHQTQKKRRKSKTRVPSPTNGEDIYFGTYEGSEGEATAATGGINCEDSFFKVPSVQELEIQAANAAISEEEDKSEESFPSPPLLEEVKEVQAEGNQINENTTETKDKNVKNGDDCKEPEEEAQNENAEVNSSVSNFSQTTTVRCYFEQFRLSCHSRRPPGTSPSVPGMEEFGQFGVRRSLSDSTIHTMNHFSYMSQSASSDYTTISSPSIPDDIPENLQIEIDAKDDEPKQK